MSDQNQLVLNAINDSVEFFGKAPSNSLTEAERGRIYFHCVCYLIRDAESKHRDWIRISDLYDLRDRIYGKDAQEEHDRWNVQWNRVSRALYFMYEY